MKRVPRLADLPAPPRNKSGWPWTEETAQLPASMHEGAAWPLVSIVTPSYQQGQYIEKTIRSVLLQGYPNLEYIVIDGGSTDQTVDIIKKYEPWLNYWVSAPDDGQSDAINKGFRRTTGHILNWLNSDDFLEKNALMQVATAFSSADENVGAVVGMASWITKFGDTFPCNFPSEISRKTLLQWCVADEVSFLQPACFFSRDAWEFGGPLIQDLRYCMDVALYVKISERFRFERLPKIIAYALPHPAAKTVAEGPHAKGEVALFFATLPDGFGPARAVMNDLIDRELAAQTLLAVGGREIRRFGRGIGRGIGLGYVRRAVRRLTSKTGIFSSWL
jgi:hypothetical protein